MKNAAAERSDGSRARGLALGALLLAIGVVLGACGNGSQSAVRISSNSTQAPVGHGDVTELKWGINGSTNGINPWTPSGSEATGLSLANAVTGLLQYDGKGHLEPSLATSWKQLGSLTYVYELRTNARFSDGKPVTLRDVLYSMRRGMNPKTGGIVASYYTNVRSVRGTGPHEVTVTLKRPDPTWIYNSATGAGGPGQVLEQAASEQAGTSLGSPSALPVAAGPYEVTQFVPDDHITLERNPYYYGPKPRVAKVVLYYFKDDGSRLDALRSGSIDGTFRVPASQTPQYKSIPTVALLATPGLYYKEFDFNVTREPFNDVHIRRAFAYAWNRQEIVNRVLHGNGEVGTAVQAPWLWVGAGMSEQQARQRFRQELPQYPYDMAKARAELKQSSRPNGGFSATVEYPSTDQDFGKALQVLAASLKQLNITLHVKELEFNRWAADIFSHNYAVGSTFNLTSTPEPVTQAVLSYSSTQAVPNGFNFASYRSPQMDALLNRVQNEPNERKRGDLMMQVVKLEQTDLPNIIVWWDYSVMAIKKRLVYQDYGALYVVNTWATHIFPAAGAS